MAQVVDCAMWLREAAVLDERSPSLLHVRVPSHAVVSTV